MGRGARWMMSSIWEVADDAQQGVATPPPLPLLSEEARQRRASSPRVGPQPSDTYPGALHVQDKENNAQRNR
jgi:hypothetical protein